MNPTPTERLFAVVAGHGPDATDLVAGALAVAGRAHHGDFRESGDPHVTHPVVVAATVADLGADLAVIVAALLHDVPGRTTYPIKQVRAEFGDAVGDLLDAVVELNNGVFDDLALVDPRAVTLKVACRLHNMRTIGWLEKSAQQRKADQTRRLVVPMALSLGFAAVAAELDMLATDTLGHPTLPRDAGDLTDLERGAGLRAARGLLRALARLLLPGDCRERWLAEWDAELHALPSRRDRVAFITALLPGLPAMAVHARRPRHVPPGADR